MEDNLSAYSKLSTAEKNRFRRNALVYYHRHKAEISAKRKIIRDTDPNYKLQRNRREDSPRYKKMRFAYHLRTKYGLTISDVTQMYNRQNKRCAICLRKLMGIKNRFTHIDHDHKTGKVREILCSGCNCALGNINEDPSIVKNILKYLQKWKT